MLVRGIFFQVISFHLMLSLHDDKHKFVVVVEATLLSQGRLITIILFKWLSFHLTIGMRITSHFDKQTAVATHFRMNRPVIGC